MAQVRIIGGQWRGRKLPLIEHKQLKPTPDRVKETLFNWLQSHIVGSVCLDLFAGSGALGFESLSRGAKEVVFIEQNKQLVHAIKQQAKRLQAATGDIYQLEAVNWLQHNSREFDIIFLDPPFGEPLLATCLQLICQKQLLKPNGLIYVETDTVKNIPEGYSKWKQTKVGRVHAMLLKPE